MSLTKAQVARRQLGTALSLYIDNLDPVSVHVLACGGGEIAEQLVLQANRHPLSSMWPDIGAARQRSDLYWNAFKHATTKRGQDRADQELLSEFDDRRNDEALLVGSIIIYGCQSLANRGGRISNVVHVLELRQR